ncbi:MAG: carbohydrate ABC transporter permease, partial [Spirochaetales bacterium]|nr:carbohydrate ABC transporter permease [Spirochaetales bacterium]
MKNSVNLKEKIITQTVLIVLSIIFLLPMVYVLISSFKVAGIGNYTYLFTSGFPIVRMIFNSVLVSFLQVFLIVAVSSPAAFAFSKIKFPGRDIIFLIIMLTMSISLLCFITPLFQTMKALGWINTYAALVLPAAT